MKIVKGARPVVRTSPRDRWVVVLAGGEGQRLSGLCAALHGRAVPKQYAQLLEGASLLQLTVERALTLAPADRIVVVCTTPWQDVARAQLEAFGGVHVLVQPRNAGTTLGLLAGLAYVLRRDPRARVAFLPSDHHFDDPVGFCQALSDALDSPLAAPLALLAVEPNAPETEYGWVRTGAALGRAGAHAAFEGAGFVEKPDAATAAALLCAGALWNTFVLVADGESLWRLCREVAPAATWALESVRHARGSAQESLALTEAYARGPESNFSRDVLERVPLRVVRIPSFGWSDWGTPDRVFRSLRGPALESLRRRAQPAGGLAASGAPAFSRPARA
jgi:mannose-1-phosphate guanylyltransferase